MDMDVLVRDVEQHPDTYHYERARRLGVSKSCIQAALKRLGIRYKKNTKASESCSRIATSV